MRKFIFTNFIFLFSFFNAQSIAVNYDFTVNNTMINRKFNFPATLKADQSGTKLYHVKFGIENSGLLQNGNEMIVFQKGTQDYFLFVDNKKTTYIVDQISNHEYCFKDNFDEFKWNFSNETKLIDNKSLKKATAVFRGRKYTIWYDDKSNVKAGPWKFNNLPGLVYQAYDENENFEWTLKSANKLEGKIENPFTNFDGTFKSYKEYPKLRYGLSSKLQEDLKSNPYNTITEQPRNALEIIFEWE